MRSIRQLTGFNNAQRRALEMTQERIWEFYRCLKEHKRVTTPEKKTRPTKRFEEIFLTSTCHDAVLRDANCTGANLCQANLMRADVGGAHFNAANLEEANVTRIMYAPSTLMRGHRGIRAATCYGSRQFKRFAEDQDFLEELRASGSWRNTGFWLWWVFADCGRSFTRWALWSLTFALLFAIPVYIMGADHFTYDPLPVTFGTAVYYSIVTFSTLGFGDITPITPKAAALVVAEVILGYIMLGGLVSIMASKLARRS